MDTLTHGLAGALLGRGAAREGRAAAMVAVAAVGAMFPDVDAFFMPGSWFRIGGTMDYLRYHRGVTHSFLLAPLFALAIALAARLAARRPPLGALWAAALIGIVSHILFDWITSYGTMFFSPVSWGRFALDWVFILDPYFTGIPVAALVLAAVFRPHARTIGIAGSILLFLYIGGCAAMHARAESAGRRMFPGARVSALPQPFSPRRWAIFADRGDAIEVAYVRIGRVPTATPTALPAPAPKWHFLRRLANLNAAYQPPGTAVIQRFPTEEGNPAVAAARAAPDVAAWFRFARFPVAQIEPLADGGSRVTFTDLRFRGPWGRPAFQYEVLLSPSGRERAAGFVRMFVVEDSRRRS